MSLSDMPVWVQQIYWKLHGPVGHPQPRAKGYHDMSGVVMFLAIEALLAVLIILGLWGIDKLGASGTLAWCLKALLVICLGAIMITKLFGFMGV